VIDARAVVDAAGALVDGAAAGIDGASEVAADRLGEVPAPARDAGSDGPVTVSDAADGSAAVDRASGVGADHPVEAGQAPPTPDLARGLVGYWKMDETTGTSVADSSGRGNAGTVLGNDLADSPPWTAAGRRNGALAIVPVREIRVLVPDHPSLDPTTAITVAVWIRPDTWSGSDGTGPGTRRILQKGAINNQYRLLVQNGELRFYVTGVGLAFSPTLPDLDAWHHVAGSFDGSTIRLYVDGVEVDADTPAGPLMIARGTEPLHLGTRGTGVDMEDDYFAGALDEVAIYDRALDAAEVRVLGTGAAFPGAAAP
jgi:hypothetical protein